MKTRSASGFSLVEIMIAVAISGIVMMTLMSIVSPMMQLKGQVDSNTALMATTMYVRDCIANQTAWTQTISGLSDTSLACLRDYTQTCTGGTTPKDISLLNAAGNACVTGYDTASTSTTGFTSSGAVCNGFSAAAGAGSSRCPFRLNVKLTVTCPRTGPNPCFNPMVTVIGQMIYNPGDNPQIKMPPNLNKYSFRMIRGRADQNRYFSLSERKDPGVPGGTCGANVTRIFDPATLNDPAGYVAGVDAASGKISLQPGTYDCQISVPGFAVNNFQAWLFDATRSIVLLYGTSEFSPAIWGNTQSHSEITGTFTLNQPTDVFVQQTCSSLPSDPGLQTQTMGVPAGIAPKEVYSVMNCWVIGF